MIDTGCNSILLPLHKDELPTLAKASCFRLGVSIKLSFSLCAIVCVPKASFLLRKKEL